MEIEKKVKLTRYMLTGKIAHNISLSRQSDRLTNGKRAKSRYRKKNKNNKNMKTKKAIKC